MFHVLVVDDDTFSVEAILCSIHWDLLHVERVFSASSLKEAKNIFLQEQIDVMLCDIEMPGGDGIALMTWVKENFPQTVNLFLTCHSDFHYAREAVSLGAFEYLLKPIEYDKLQQYLFRALSEFQNRSELLSGKKKWFFHHEIMVDRFWHDLLLEKCNPSLDFLQEDALKKDIALLLDGYYLPILITIQNYTKLLDSWYGNDIDFIFRNIAYEVLSIQDFSLFITATSDSCKVLLFCYQPKYSLEQNGAPQIPTELFTLIQDKLYSLMEILTSYFHAQVTSKIGTPSTLELLSTEYRNLIQDSSSKVLPGPSLHYPHLVRQKEYYQDSNLNLLLKQWLDLVFSNEPGKLIVSFNNYCSKYFQNSLRIYELLFQVILIELLKKNINVYTIYTDKRIKTPDHRLAAIEIPGQLRTLCLIIRENLGAFTTGETVITQVQDYIKNHLMLDLSRETLAKKFFLNPNYFSMLFKKKTEISLQDYILQERIKKARFLLDTTKLSISEIHQQIGISNSSYFSKIFKRETGMTPIQYKRRNEN